MIPKLRQLQEKVIVKQQISNSEAYSDLCQAPKMERFAKILGTVNYLCKTFYLRCLTGF